VSADYGKEEMSLAEFSSLYDLSSLLNEMDVGWGKSGFITGELVKGNEVKDMRENRSFIREYLNDKMRSASK
jgi:hypothetical protein